jgi:hypothetical protein
MRVDVPGRTIWARRALAALVPAVPDAEDELSERGEERHQTPGGRGHAIRDSSRWTHSG